MRHPAPSDCWGRTVVGRSGVTVIGAARVSAAVLSAFALVLTGASALGWHTLQSIEGNLTVAPDLGDILSPSGEGAVNEQTGLTAENILIVGSDTRTGQGSGFGDASQTASGNGHSDTTILLHISADRTRAFGVSIPRDSLVVRPGCTSSGKIEGMAPQSLFNTAYAVGGRKCVIAAVKYLTGVKVDHFVEVSFLGFQKIVDALGGVTIDACTRLRDPVFHNASGWHGSGLDLPKGVSTLDGKTALQFVRARNINGGDDRDRIHRQQQFLSSIIRSASESGLLTDPGRLVSVLNAVAGSLTVDAGLSGDGLNEFLLSIAGMKPSEIQFFSVPTKGAPDGSSLLWITDEADQMWQAMKDDPPYPPPSSGATPSAPAQPVLTVAPTAISVKVLNGTSTRGLGTKAADQLRKLGFTVTSVGNAKPKGQTTTTMTYDPSWDVSASTLEWAANATGTAAPGQGRTMVLTVGSDWSGVRKPVITDPSTRPAAAADTSCIS